MLDVSFCHLSGHIFTTIYTTYTSIYASFTIPPSSDFASERTRYQERGKRCSHDLGWRQGFDALSDTLDDQERLNMDDGIAGEMGILFNMDIREDWHGIGKA